MKKLLIIALLFISASSFAQTRTYTANNIQQGQYIDLGGTPTTPTDSLQVTDSLAYIVPITHLNVNDVFHTFYWQKVGASTATLTINYFQSNDNVNYFAVPKGAAQSAYTKTFTLSASTPNYVSFAADTALLQGRYLKIQCITSSTASVKGYLSHRVKTNIK